MKSSRKGRLPSLSLSSRLQGSRPVKSLAIEGKMIKDWENSLGEYILSAFKLSNIANIAVSSSQMLPEG